MNGHELVIDGSGLDEAAAIEVEAGNLTIEGGDTKIISDQGGISVIENSTVVLEGDVAAAYGISAWTSQVTLVGDISAATVGISAHSASTVSMIGDITAGTDGVTAWFGSGVVVEGNVTAGHSGVFVQSEGNTVEVFGNINAESDGVWVQFSNYLAVVGDISAGGTGITAREFAGVVMEGNIIATGAGVFLVDSAEVWLAGTISGNPFASVDGTSITDGQLVDYDQDWLWYSGHSSALYVAKSMFV